MDLNIALEILPPKMYSFNKKTRGQLFNCDMIGYLFIGMLMSLYPVAVSSQNVIELSLNEELSVNTKVGNIINAAELHKRYNHTVLSKLHFQILTNSPLVTNNFRILQNSPDLLTKSIIDRDTICAFMDTCDIALDIGVQPTEYFQILKFVIHIIDVNDNSPVFPESSVSLFISESTLPGASFAIPAAEDADSGTYGIASFQLLNYQSTFGAKVTETGDGSKDLSLTLKSGLDREINSFYSLQLVAVDGGSPAKSGTVTVEISVLDTNDNSPVFENSLYEVYVDENEPIGTSLIQVRASDKDEGQHGEIFYELSRQSSAQFGNIFHINPKTGEITTKDYIDYEQNKVYTLRVVAKDSGPSSMAGYAQVNIKVRDINDNAPEITVNALSASGYAEVKENKSPDEFVAHISVADPDGGSNGQVICSIDSSNFRLVQLYPKEYKIVTNFMFDREVKADYDIIVTCLDTGNSPQVSTRTINVTIIDVNDHRPVFQREIYEVKLQENSGTGMKLLKINTTDLDIGDNSRVEYSLQSVGLYGDNVLEVDTISGDIIVKDSLNYEVQSEYTYNIVATDKGIPPMSSTATLVLKIIDVNDEVPTFSQPRFMFTVKEDIPIDTVVGKIMAYDLDSAPYNKITYSMITIGSDSKFKVDPNSGEIISTGLLDKELMLNRQSFEMMVTASNIGYGLQNSVEVSIYVDDVNDNAPVIIFPSAGNSSIQVKSSFDTGDFVTQIRASDPDMGKNAILKYSIIPEGNELFHISEDTGKIYASRSLRNFGGKEVKFLIQVSDNGDKPLSIKTQLSIIINATLVVDKPLVTDLSFVVAVVVTSVVMVALAVVIFVIFLIRRRRKNDFKKKVMYSCTVENRDENTSTTGSDSNTDKGSIPTVSSSVPEQTKTDNWPDVIDVNQILSPAGKHNQRRSSFQKESKQQRSSSNNNLTTNSNNKRVHFKESLESVCDKSKGHPSSHLNQPAQPGCSKKSSPVFREEGRHKLLYGHTGSASQPAFMTKHNLQGYNRDDDSSSDQGSSIDSGRGPSEEEQDHNRSGHSQQSLNSSGEPVISPTDLPLVHNSNHKDSEYICMSQAQKIRDNINRKANRSNSDRFPKDRHSPSGERLPTLPPRKPRNARLAPPSYHSSNHASRLASASSPEITLDKHQQNHALASTFNNTSPIVSSGSYSDINGKNIGKYNCKNPNVLPRSHSPVQTRCEHNVVGHYPELCHHGKNLQQKQLQSQNHWSGFDYPSNSGPDTGSEGGSSTSGSYLVDHVDLGAEMSNDVFV